MSNTFEQLVGQTLLSIYTVDNSVYSLPNKLTLAMFFMLEETSGLAIHFNHSNSLIKISYTSFNEFKTEYGTDYEETVLSEIKPDEELYKLTGSKLTDVKIAKLDGNKAEGEHFVVDHEEYAMIVLGFENGTLRLYTSNEGAKFHIGKDDSFTLDPKWVLR